MTLNRLLITVAVLALLAGAGIAWFWEYAYSTEGRARIIVAQLKGDNSLRSWMLQHHIVRRGFPEPSEDPTSRERHFNGFNLSRREFAAGFEIIKLGSDASPAVVESLTDSDMSVRSMAVMACGGIRDPAAIGPLIRAMCREDPNKDWVSPNLYEESLVRIGPAACDSLIALLDDANEEIRRSAVDHEDIRYCAAEALIELREKRALDAVVCYLNKENDCGNALALAKLGDSRAIPILRRLSEHSDPEIRKRATEALQELGLKPLSASQCATSPVK